MKSELKVEKGKDGTLRMLKTSLQEGFDIQICPSYIPFSGNIYDLVIRKINGEKPVLIYRQKLTKKKADRILNDLAQEQNYEQSSMLDY